MIVADTSAWIELFRATESPVAVRLERLLAEGAPVAVTDVIVMELLAGTRAEDDALALRSRLLALSLLTLRGLADYEAAAALHRACRRAGENVRKLVDCLIAVPTIDAGATLLHADADFDVLARHTALRVESLPAA
ncbi:MAG: PIN domain nuclease [Actinomycetota bacterium]|nr:PIN domain nuclease [Actinomycetota bacterium]